MFLIPHYEYLGKAKPSWCYKTWQLFWWCVCCGLGLVWVWVFFLKKKGFYEYFVYMFESAQGEFVLGEAEP